MTRIRLVTGALAVFAMAAVFFVAYKDGGTRERDKATGGAFRGQAMPPPLEAVTHAPTVQVVPVVERHLDRVAQLPGEMQPYLSVDLYPKVTGIVEAIRVDRGSRVKRGELLVRLVAPELSAQRAEAEAKLRSDELTYHRLQTAAAAPGVVAPNDLEVSQKTTEAARARVKALRQMERYLRIEAPFDGVITERNVHPGALVGPAGAPGANIPMLRLEHNAQLRLTVPVPEAYVGGIVSGEAVPFTVPAFPGETFHGVITRIARSVEVKTRTMPVELDVENPTGRLAPGMFPEVAWPVRRPQPTLFVPVRCVVTTTELTFVIRIRDGTVEWVRVRRGDTIGEAVEVFGSLRAGDEVVARGTDELRAGTRVSVARGQAL